MPLPFFEDSIAGQPIYRCLQCKFDSFSASTIRTHCALHEQLVPPETGIPIAMWEKSRQNCLGAAKIAICFLTWNTVKSSALAARAIANEYQRLLRLGCQCKVFWADNGSYDGTQESVGMEFAQIPYAHSLFDTNFGQSVARNSMISLATVWGYDYLLMVDGDVEIVPYSAFALARYLSEHPSNIGCIGLHCHNSTHIDDANVSTECRYIATWMADSSPRIAWTNYGMFRREVLDIVRFDEAEPFLGPGWGFEDDDLCLSMLVSGFECRNTKWFRHMHRRRHSSLRLLDPSLAAKVFNYRKRYLIEKWAPLATTNVAIDFQLRLLVNQHFTAIDD